MGYRRNAAPPPAAESNGTFWRMAASALVSAVAVVAGLWLATTPASANNSVTVTPLGWNVVGLDSNNVNTGPNQFPIGARVCSTAGVSQTVTVKWEWLSSNANVNLATGTSDTVGPWTLAAGACRDVYYTVEVKRTTAAYLTSRNFRIGVNNAVYTPANRQIYVEKLVSQNRNVVDSLSGPGISPNTTPVLVGNEYTYTLKGSTATQGYEQLVFATIFDPRYFEILSVSTNYSADSSAIVPNPNDQVYGDGCGWVNDTTSNKYRSCTGTGKIGGTMTSTIKVRVIGAGSAKLNSIIYDFSGSSYHYNADFGGASVTPSITPKEPNPKLSLVKTSSPATFDSAGTTLNYTITATNSGDVPLTNVTVSDPTLPKLSCTPATPVATLAVGSSITCTGSYTTVQADVERGFVSNTASTSGTAPSGASVTNTTTVKVPGPEPAPELSVVKSSDPTTFAESGKPLKFTVVATNTGNVNLTGVNVTDGNADVKNWACSPTTPVATLAPAAKITCTGDYTTTQADVDAGKVVNSATATGKDGQNNTITRTSSIDVPGPVPNPKFAVVKSSEPATFSTPGQTLDYTVTVTNIGNVRLSSVQVTDKNVAVTNWSCSPSPIGSLAPGQSATCTGKYLTTQDDVELGKTTNTAEATGLDPQGKTITGTGDIEVPGPAPAPKLELSKSAAPKFFNAAGQSVTYTVVATNTGNVTLKNADVTDGNVDVKNFSCSPSVPVATLAPGAKITCTGDYTTTQADVDAGRATNPASATADAPDDSPVSADTTINVPGPQPNPKLDVVKTSSPPTFSGPGQKLDYTITVTNTGNVGLSAVEVSDPLLKSLSCTPNTPAGLAVGSSITCQGSYTTTQADVEAGNVFNTATASGKDPKNQTVTGSGSVEVPGPEPAAKLVLAKSASPASFTTKDQSVTYTVTATNTGNVTLKSVDVTDENAAVKNFSCSPATPAATLAPGEKVTCTGDYVTTQADVDAGKTSNTAKATGKAPDDTPVNAETTIDVPGPRAAPQLSVAKSANPATFSASGQEVTFAILVTNTGNVTLTNVNVTDPMFTVTCPPPFPAPTLAPGASMPCLGKYTTTGADVAAGKISNTATATGKDPKGQDVTGTGSTEVPGPAPAPKLELTKSANPAFFSTSNQGIEYTVVATNTGNVPLADVSVTDGNAAVESFSCNPESPATTLAPGEKITCTGFYTTTQDDVNAGKANNTASATGKAPDNTPVDATTSIDVPGPPPVTQLSVVKSSSPTSFNAAGQKLDYTVKVSNAGNVTLTAVDVTDPMFAALSCTPSTPVATLDPGADITCTGSYTTTQADVEAGKVSNTATASGKDPKNQDVTSTGTVEVPGPAPAPKLALTKSSAPTYFSAGSQSLKYTVVATNTGNVTLKAVSVTDGNAAVENWSCTPTTPAATLAPGAKITCTGDYTTTQADVDAGKTTNPASATGKAPDNTDITANTSIDVPGPAAAPALEIVKSATPAVFTDSGQMINYSITATNTGNVSLANATISDPMFAALNCTPTIPVATLAPGAGITCTGEHITTEEELAAGNVFNVATVQAEAPDKQILTKQASAQVPRQRAEPDMSITKTANPATFSKAGDKITYTVTVSNIGGWILDAVTITDPALEASGGLSCTWPTIETGTLSEGESVVCTGEYTITQADVEAGQIFNSASAEAMAGGDIPVGPVYTEIMVPGPAPSPSIAVTKTADPAFFTATGTKINYTVTATNTGNVTLDPVTVTDPVLTGIGNFSCVYPAPAVQKLAPDESVTCTGEYTTTKADVQAGETTNAAGAEGLFGTTTVKDNTSITVPGPAASSALSIVKSSNPATFNRAGQTLTFSIVATNVGNQPLTAVEVTDSMELNNWTCDPVGPVEILEPDATITCSGEYVTTQADVEAGKVVNSVQVQGTGPGPQVVSKNTEITVNGPPASPGIALTKAATPTSFAKVGDVITYTVTAINTGNVILDSVVVTDPVLDATQSLTCTWPEGPPQGQLAPGAQLVCTGDYTTTQDDVEAGSAVNAASVEAQYKQTVLTDGAEVTVPGPAPNPALAIVKSSNPTTFNAADQTISFSVVATNTGNVTLTDVGLTDSMQLTNWSCSPGVLVTSLVPGATVTCSGSYKTTQDDVEAGKVVNTATVEAKAPGDTPISKKVDLEVRGPDPDPAIALVKSADPSAFTNAGDKITYTVTATNTGNLSLTGVQVTDGNPDVKNWSCTPQTPAPLAPGAKITCTGDYTATQADVEAGKTTNAASVEAFSGQTKLTDDTTIDVPGPDPKPALSIVKSATPTSFTGPGQTLTFSVTATNSGNLTLSNVNVTDSMELTEWSCTPGSSAVTLAPGAQVTCSGKYTTTQADVEAGKVTNAVEATGTAPGEKQVSKQTEVNVSGPEPNPAIAIVKKANPVTFAGVGETINYSWSVQNKGNVTLGSVVVTDENPNVTNINCTPAASVATLAPDATISCTGEYTTTQDDVEAGKTVNSAKVTASYGGNSLEETDDVTVPGPNPNPALTLVKSSTPATFATPGTKLTFLVTATNAGNLTLTNVSVTDSLVDPGSWNCTWPQGQQAGTLSPNQAVSCTGEYTTTLADVDNGKVVNNAEAEGTPPKSGEITRKTKINVPGPDPAPTLAVVKTSNPTTFDQANETLNYTVVVTNTGNVTIKNVTAADAKVPNLSCDVTTPVDMSPGDTFSCTGSYTTTQADVDAGKTENTVVVDGTKPDGSPLQETGKVVVPGPKPGPFLSVVKTSLPTTFSAPEETLDYTVVVTNTGNQTLTDVSVSDDVPAVTGWSCTPSGPQTLAPGDAIECTGSYATTQADVNAGYVDNAATATGNDPLNKTVTGSDTIRVPGPAASPQLEVVKTSDPTSFTGVGQSIDYTVVTTNTGNVTMTDVNVIENNPDVTNWSCQPNVPITLQPGDSITCTGEYVTTQADVNAGQATNSATATGKDPQDRLVEVTGVVYPQGPERNPVLTLSKTVDPTTFTAAGQTLTFTVVAKNEGNVTLYQVAPRDDNPEVKNWTCAPATPATLQPGGSVSCTGTYVTTQADMDAGQVLNSASASAESPTGSAPERSVDRDVEGPSADPALTLEKTASPASFSKAGQVIEYSFRVKNTGNVSVGNLSINDPRLQSPAVCPAIALAPGAETTCTGAYAITQADMDAGQVLNTATAQATPARGKLTPPTSSVTVTKSEDEADLAIKKSNNGPVRVGGQAKFTLKVSNNGPGSATAVKVVDALPKGLEFVSASGAPTAQAEGGRSRSLDSLSAVGDDWTCKHSSGTVTCTLGSVFPVGATSDIVLTVKVGDAARPSVTNSATVSSVTPDPNLSNNTDSNVLVVDRAPQPPKTKNRVVTKAGELFVTPGRTVAGQRIRTKVSCKPLAARAAGEVSYCRVNRGKNGKVTIEAVGKKRVKVRVLFWAPGTKEYKPYRKIQTYVLKPKK